MNMRKGQERHDVYYQGRVQGVGFRYTVRQLASDFSLTGFVQNLPDGRVLLVIEGTKSETSKFLRAIEGHLGHYISGKSEECLPATGSFQRFEIRF